MSNTPTTEAATSYCKHTEDNKQPLPADTSQQMEKEKTAFNIRCCERQYDFSCQLSGFLGSITNAVIMFAGGGSIVSLYVIDKKLMFWCGVIIAALTVLQSIFKFTENCIRYNCARKLFGDLYTKRNKLTSEKLEKKYEEIQQFVDWDSIEFLSALAYNSVCRELGYTKRLRGTILGWLANFFILHQDVSIPEENNL
jgi:hypothetical protein